MRSTLEESNNVSVWNQMSPLLDQALSRLGKKDRDAVILRFFKEKNLGEVAAALKVTEAAAQRRVHRALEKLHQYFNKRGVNSTTSITAGELSANSVQAAPMGLAKSVTAAAVGKGAAASASTLTLIKGALKIMAWAKAKTAVTIATIIACAAGGYAGIYAYRSSHLELSDQPQVILLSDGTKLTLLGTTFGNRHMAPGYENLQTANWIYTAPDTTVVWIKEEPGNQPIYELLVSDRANTGCVNLEARQRSFVKPGVSLQSFVLSAFPRWDTETILRVRPYRGAVVKGEFVLTNPVPGTFAQWTPKPLPETASDGDLEVTLTKLVAGAPAPHYQGRTNGPLSDPANRCVRLDFDFRENGQSTTNWDPWPVRTTDAAGNWSRGLIYPYPMNGIYPNNPKDGGHDGYFFQPGLWPDEPWKVRLEFIQRSGFNDDETVTFTNLPVKPGSQQEVNDEWTAWDVGKTNFPFTITPATVNGVHLQLLPPLLVDNRWQSSEKDISIIIGADAGFNPKGMNLTVVAATDDQGRPLWSFERPAWAGHYSIEFARVHDDIKSLTLKLALHKSRFVEFTVKPEKSGDAP